MKYYFSFILLLLAVSSTAQMSFKTIAPQKPIVEGEAFQVQYVLQDGKKATNMNAPFFRGFRVVSGPNVYIGNVSTLTGLKSLHNIAYTLEATSRGFYVIPGATILVNGKMVRSNDLQVEVISKEQALKEFNKQNELFNSEYFLKPGEDPYKKIRDNLYIKVQVDKQSCLVGEPILATFKLYSRLESRSDIVKNPGLYGFAVYDMVNLADKEVKAEKINGKDFDVHTIRKVQLYPLQSGTFTVDAMEVKNRVEFSRTAVDRRTEQEVVEGLQGFDENSTGAPGSEIFESISKTEPVTINVKPLTAKNKPDSFSGAVGHFEMVASLRKNELLRNEEGFVELVVSGKGNFIQLDAPFIRWPDGLEGFEANLKDDLDKMKIPLAGTRRFIYPFVAVKAGIKEIPSVEFSYYDTDSNKYKTVKTTPLKIKVSDEEVKAKGDIEVSKPGKKAGFPWLILIVILIITGLAGILILKSKQKHTPVSKINIAPATKDYFSKARELIVYDEHFYTALRAGLWEFVSDKFGLKGSDMNKRLLSAAMKMKDIPDEKAAEFNQLIENCETAMFTSAKAETNKYQMIRKAEEMTRQIDQILEPDPGSEYL